MNNLSIRFRVGVSFGMIILIVIAIVSSVAFFEFREAQINSLDSRLKFQVNALVTSLDEGHDIDEEIDEIVRVLNADSTISTARHLLWFDAESEHIHSNFQSQLTLNKILKKVKDSGFGSGERYLFDFMVSDNPCRVIFLKHDISRPYQDRNYVNILLSISSSHELEEIEEFLSFLVFFGLASILLSTVFIMRIVNWGFKPIDQLSRYMNQTSGDKAFEAKDGAFETVPELKSFVSSWSRMMQRISESMKREKRFTADASHELRTPLASIKCRIQVARSKERTAKELEQSLDESIVDVIRMENQIEQLLLLARLDVNEDSDMDIFDVNEVIASVVDWKKMDAEQKDIEIVMDLRPAIVKSNKTQIESLVSNLVDNAIKHGPVSAKVTISSVEESGWVKITVHDEGGGISEDESKMIFDRFFRVDKSRSRITGGSGLGLAIAREIAKKNGGDIVLKSNTEYGTDFTVLLPLYSNA